MTINSPFEVVDERSEEVDAAGARRYGNYSSGKVSSRHGGGREEVADIKGRKDGIARKKLKLNKEASIGQEGKGIFE